MNELRPLANQATAAVIGFVEIKLSYAILDLDSLKVIIKIWSRKSL